MINNNNSTYQDAYKYYKQSDYKRSIEILKKLNDVKSKRLLAGIYANKDLGKRYIDEAIDIFKEIIPYDKFYAYELASLLYMENRKREALDYYLEALSDEIPAASYHAAYLYKEFGSEYLFIKYLNISAKQKYIFAKEALFSYRNQKTIFHRLIAFIYKIFMFVLHVYYIITGKHKERWM